jgi:hypothetical protein
MHLLSPATPTPPDPAVVAAATDQPPTAATPSDAPVQATAAPATAPTAAAATPAAPPAAWTIPAGINGPNLRSVTFNGGKARIAQTGDKQWAEYSAEGGGKEIAKFVEMQRDEWSVYLADDSRQMRMQLDIYRGMIRLGQGGGAMADYQKIETASKE